MPTGANLPSVARVMELADSFGIDMNSEEASLYRGFMKGLINSSRRVDSLTEENRQLNSVTSMDLLWFSANCSIFVQ